MISKITDEMWADAERMSQFARAVIPAYAPTAPPMPSVREIIAHDVCQFYGMALMEVLHRALIDNQDTDGDGCERLLATCGEMIAEMRARHGGVPYFAFIKARGTA